MIKRLVPLFLFLPLAVLYGEMVLQPDSWPVRTLFPGSPSITESQVSNARYFARAMVRKGTEIYGLQRMTFDSNESPRSPTKGYEAVKKLYLDRPGTELIEEGDTKILGLVGKRFLLTYRNGERTVEIRAIYIGSEYYEFLYERYTRDKPSADSAKFFDGAEIIEVRSPESGVEGKPKN